jgi:pentatricopeptide repeat protein
MSVITIQEIGSVIADVQTELVFFLLAIATHFLFFHKLRLAPRTKKSKEHSVSPVSTKKYVQSQKGMALAPSGGVLALKASLQAGDFKSAMSQFEELQGLWQNHDSPSSAPNMMIDQVLKLAAQSGALFEFLQLLTRMNMLDDCLELVLAYCAEQGDATLSKKVHEFGARQGVKLSSRAYQALIKVAGNYGTQADAQELMTLAREAGVADPATYNAYMNALLKWGSTQEVRQALADMVADGLQPNTTSFNKLLGAIAASKTAHVWSIIEDMKVANVKPDQFTCAILLKSRCINSKAANIEKVIAILDGLEGEMDDVLFNSVVDACMRVGRADLLTPFLKAQRSRPKSTSSKSSQSSHTYGTIIRAYGSIQDIQGAWATWEEMKKQGITPISVTLGCMVEALVTNGDIDGGHKLIQEMCKDEKTAHLVNAVMYGSIVKGFSHKKCFDRMWKVYDEMVAKQLQFSMVTFNTLIDACARSGDLSRIPLLLRDIESQGLKMGLVTYSAILKGYCQKNMLDEAFELFDDMTRNTGLEPDEIMYNSLLDGCARQGLYDRGLKLYRKMEASGVRPSNYTLSVLVKMANRGKKLEKAFELCEELSKNFGFRLNVHVFANLIQACIQHHDVQRGMGVLQRMLQEGVRPDVRSYSLLLKACVETRRSTDANGLLRAALGLSGPHQGLARFAKNALMPQGGLPGDLITEVLQGLADFCGKDELAATLLAEVSRLPGQKIDQKVRLRLAARMGRH